MHLGVQFVRRVELCQKGGTRLLEDGVASGEVHM